MPVFTTWVTPYKSAITCTQSAALTLPTPHGTITTGIPRKSPDQNVIPARWDAEGASNCSRNRETSTSMAPMIPNLFMFPPLLYPLFRFRISGMHPVQVFQDCQIPGRQKFGHR